MMTNINNPTAVIRYTPMLAITKDQQPPQFTVLDVHHWSLDAQPLNTVYNCMNEWQ